MIPKSFVNSEMVVVHVIDDADKVAATDIKIPSYDIRSNKPLGVHSLEDKQIAFFQRLVKTKIGDSNINVAAPNEISLSLNISKKSQENSFQLKKLLTKKLDSIDESIFNDEVSLAYDYLEEIQKAVIFSYKAIESFCNEAIPDDYIYKKKNPKGIEEHYGKEQIERWISTSEKVSEILPAIFDNESPKGEKFWSSFKNLERLRNEIIHSKSNASSDILAELFSNAVNGYLDSSLSVLSFFISQDSSNQLFPLGFGVSEMKIIEVKNSDEIIKKLK